VQVFVNARLQVSGGALGGGRMVEDSSSVAGLRGTTYCSCPVLSCLERLRVCEKIFLRVISGVGLGRATLSTPRSSEDLPRT